MGVQRTKRLAALVVLDENRLNPVQHTEHGTTEFHFVSRSTRSLHVPRLHMNAHECTKAARLQGAVESSATTTIAPVDCPTRLLVSYGNNLPFCDFLWQSCFLKSLLPLPLGGGLGGSCLPSPYSLVSPLSRLHGSAGSLLRQFVVFDC